MKYLLICLFFINIYTDAKAQVDSVSCFYDLFGDLYKVQCLKDGSITTIRYFGKDKLSSFVLQNDKYDLEGLQKRITMKIRVYTNSFKSELVCGHREFVYCTVFVQGRYYETRILKSDFDYESNIKIASIINDFFKQNEIHEIFNACFEMEYFEYVYCNDIRKSH